MSKQAITKLCGHTVEESMAGLGNWRQAVANSKLIFCLDCKMRLVNLMSATVENPTVFKVYHLRGSPAQVSWANSLRSKAADRLAHVHAGLAGDDTLLAKGFERLMMLLFSINEAAFWIESREFLLNPYCLADEAAYILRSHFGAPPTSRSICGFAYRLGGRHLEACRDTHKVEEYFGYVLGRTAAQKAS